MAKITQHRGIMGVAKSSDKNGEYLVDPAYHADQENLPEDVQDGARAFREKVITSPTGYKTRQAHEYSDSAGATSKTFLKVLMFPRKKGSPAVPSKVFMIKPYWEDLSDWEWSYYPLGGWAEMAFQGLMHAGNLGHMSQKVHTFRINDKKKTPMLAVELEKGVHPIGNAHVVGDYFGKNGEDYGAVDIDEERRHDAAKLAALDFLTNNQDRHGSNLMYRVDVDHGEGKATMTDLLAIDHGRAFQYRAPLRFVGNDEGDPDFMPDYLSAPGYEVFDLNGDIDVFTEVADWWKGKRKLIMSEFNKHLAQIKDAHAYKHIKRNFYARAKIMDKFVNVYKDLFKGKRTKVNRQARAAVTHYIPEHKPNARYPYGW